jgi:hypothetical protein
MPTLGDMAVAPIHFAIRKAQAITTDKLSIEFASDYCSNNASSTPNYWQHATDRTPYAAFGFSVQEPVIGGHSWLCAAGLQRVD